MKILGIDIGGTFLKVIFKDGSEIKRFKIKIQEHHKSSKDFIELLKDVVHQFKPDSIGIAVAGLVDKEGLITNSPNLKYLENINIREIIKKRYSLPVFVGNDANLAAFGEYVYGNGKDGRILICLTIGTGLGGGAVIDGMILEGVSGCGMEVGHIIVEKDGELCSCGRKGCLEAYVSSYGLERIYRKLSGEYISSFEIIKLAKEGNESAMKCFDIFTDYFSIGIMNLVHIFNPDKLLIAGGVIENYPQIVDSIRKKVSEITFPLPASVLKVDIAKLGSWSGAYGALAVAEEFDDYSS